MKKNLEPNKKVQLVVSRKKSLREIAAETDVHHSTIDAIFKESEAVLKHYWQEKSEHQGRPSKAKESNEEALNESENANQALTKQLALKQMRINWLELQLKWVHERAAEAKQKGTKHLKKKKKSKK